jgi:phosphate transport system substrate-binding protein
MVAFGLTERICNLQGLNLYKTLKIIKLYLFLLLPFVSCTDSGKKGPTDTAVSGTIHIAVDEAFLPIMATEITSFQGHYPKAKIIPHYVSEEKAFRLLLADSVRMVVTGRTFNAEEKAYFKSITITTKNLKIATDALGVVLNKSNPDSMLTMRQLKQILTQPNLTWKNVSGKGLNNKPELVLDKEGSSNYFALLNLLNVKDEEIKLKRVYAGGDREVINYVNLHPGSIGFMGVNWISDEEDPTQTRFKNGIQVAYLMPDSIAELLEKHPLETNEEFFQPLQAYLAQGFYPLTRDVIVSSREARTGLATGFTAWLAGDKGQRIVLKSGLLPATMPIRIVKIKKDNDLTN